MLTAENALKSSPFLAVLVVVADLVTGSMQRSDVTKAITENTQAVYRLGVDVDVIQGRVQGQATKNYEQDRALRELVRQVDRIEAQARVNLPPYGVHP